MQRYERQMQAYVAKTSQPPTWILIGGAIVIFGAAVVAVNALRPAVAAGAASAASAKPVAASSPVAPEITPRAEVKWILGTLKAMDAQLPWREDRLEFGWRSPQDSYEAIRVTGSGGAAEYYLRSIPRLSRPVTRGGGGGILFLEDPLTKAVLPRGQLHYTFPDGTPFD